MEKVTDSNSSLALIAAKLKAEAKAYLAKSQEAEQAYDPVQEYQRFTGTKYCNIATAKAEIERLLGIERRWGRTRHPGYDLNRHISLKKLAKALKANQGAPIA